MRFSEASKKASKTDPALTDKLTTEWMLGVASRAPSASASASGLASASATWVMGGGVWIHKDDLMEEFLEQPCCNMR